MCISRISSLFTSVKCEMLHDSEYDVYAGDENIVSVETHALFDTHSRRGNLKSWWSKVSKSLGKSVSTEIEERHHSISV